MNLDTSRESAARAAARAEHHRGAGAALRRHGICIHAELEGECGLAIPTTRHVLEEIGLERDRQEAQWGQQDHPDGTGPTLAIGAMMESFADDNATFARDRCDIEHRAGRGTYEQILTEEWAEALAEDDPARLRRELVQVAAIAVAWIEAIDRRTT